MQQHFFADCKPAFNFDEDFVRFTYAPCLSRFSFFAVKTIQHTYYNTKKGQQSVSVDDPISTVSVIVEATVSFKLGFKAGLVALLRYYGISADPPHFTPAPAGCVLNEFLPITPADVVELINALPDKQSATDPLPTWLLKRSTDVLAPFLCQLFNLSLQHGCIPSSFKASYITPLLKKAGLDLADARFYRPSFNLTVISELLERIVSSQLVKYLKDKGLLPDLQSAYRAMHSTETCRAEGVLRHPVGT